MIEKYILKQIDHIGIAVNDLNEIRKTLADAFELFPDFEEEVKDQLVRVLGYKIGDSIIEYLEPVSTNSPVTKFIEKRGPGLHHIAYRVNDIALVLNRLKSKGYSLIDEIPRKGAEGKKIAFIHPKSTNGILIELCEK
jgi:lactoylglutathione lyase/methylmalonyl-CoA/ethylmalonyl-CoA epimerase